jgi:hypothetical protein
MKNCILIIIALIYLTKTISIAQTLVPYPPIGLIQGEIYHNDFSSISAGSPPIFNTSFKYIKDTLISSVIYSYFDGNSGGYYTRYSNGLIYYAGRNADGSASAETLKYNFNLIVGNTINLYGVGNLTVDSIGSFTLLNGQTRKYIRLRNSYLDKYEWIDGIGDIKRGFSFHNSLEGEYEEFICARDISGLLYVNNHSINCDSLSGYTVGIKEPLNDLVLSIYPNPANLTLTILDKQNLLNNGNVSIINYLLNGVYIVKIKTENGKLYHSKFIKTE